MAAMKGSNFFKTFIWLQIIFVSVQANSLIAADNSLPQLNTTSSLEDYISQLERQYTFLIANDEAIVAEFRASYEKQLGTVDDQRPFIETELVAVDKKLYALQFLNELSKHCVQKYRGHLYAVSAVRLNFASCIASARSSLNSILSNAESNIRTITNLFNSNFKNGIADCKRKNSASYTNHTICVLNLNNALSGSFDNYQRAFLSNIDTARCSADTRIRQAVECVFKTVNASLTSIGSTTNLVDGCVSGLEFCEPCHDQIDNNNGTAVIVPNAQCPNVIDVTTGAGLYRNDTIRNPFVGLNSTLDCILVNFLRPV